MGYRSASVANGNFYASLVFKSVLLSELVQLLHFCYVELVIIVKEWFSEIFNKEKPLWRILQSITDYRWDFRIYA